MKVQKKRVAALLTAFTMLSSVIPMPFSKVANATGYEYTNGSNLASATVGTELSGGTYYMTTDLTFNGSSTGNGLKIKAGETVTIYLNGHTLTAIGKNAEDGSNGSNGSTPSNSIGSTADGGVGGSSAGRGAYAGILLPSNSTLIFVGDGIVNATGGNAGKGGAGGNGASGKIYDGSGYDSIISGSGGGGGQGGGGAAAGIGTNGGAGSSGGQGGQGKSMPASMDDGDRSAASASNGNNNNSSTSSAGKLLVYGNNGKSGSIVMNLTGGSASSIQSNGGSVGTSYFDNGTGWGNSYTATSGAGGGAGGNGYSAPGYGAGAVGGAGGAGGASGGTWTVSGSNNWKMKFGYAGTGGAGYVNGKTGTGTSTSDYQVRGSHEQDGDSPSVYDMTGTQATGGSVYATSGSSNAGYNTYYLNGIYARIDKKDSSNNIATYKEGDYITKNDVKVYAVYSTSASDTISDTVDRITINEDYASDGFTYPAKVGGTASTLRLATISNDYWQFSVSSNETGHVGQHKLTATEILSMTEATTTVVPTGKIGITLNSSAYAGTSSFIRDIRIAMDTAQTITKTAGTNSTAQSALGNYPTAGVAAANNAATAVKTITYDNKAHSIAELLKGSGYGTNNGANSEFNITDNFFKNGLNAGTTALYNYSKYAQTPFYQVVYKPYNSFVDYNATNYTAISGNVAKSGTNLTYGTTNYLTGSSARAITVGDASTNKYADNVNTEFGSYVVNGETDTYFASGQINKALIKNAGIYTVTVVVPYRYFTYTYTNGSWYGDSVSTTNYSYFFRTYTFNIIVREADLALTEATDTVYENTKVQTHTYGRYVEGQNDEQVYGMYTYAAEYGEAWGNEENRTVNTYTPIYDDIEWEFNIYEDKYYNSSSELVDGAKNLNNYLCQYDGQSAVDQLTNTKDIKNTYYQGNDGVLLYSSDPIGTRKADMSVTINYEKDQKDVTTDNVKTASSSLDTETITSNSIDTTIKSIYAEDVEISASITSDALGWRVVKGDAVTGTSGTGTKINSSADLAEGYRTDSYYNKLIAADKYLGDLYVVTVKAGAETVAKFEYTDETATNSVNNVKSILAKQVTDTLPACEYYGVDEYDVTVEYVGLYYTTETSVDGRLATWNGEEEFNWVTSKVSFKLDVEKRNVAIKDTADFDKIYDGTTNLLKQTLTGNNVTTANKYIVGLSKDNTLNTQFSKLPGTMLYNYIDPTEGLTNVMNIEIAGNYANKNKGANKNITVEAARLLNNQAVPTAGDKVDALNYNLVDGNDVADGIATITGDINVANMKFSHEKYATLTVRDVTPLHELFGITAKAYLASSVVYEKDSNDVDTEYISTVTMTNTELVEKNDVKTSTNASFTTNATEYDYNTTYEINMVKYKQYITGANLAIDGETGAITNVATITKGGTNPTNFPAMNINIVDYPNFTVITDDDLTETATFNTCTVTNANTLTNSNEYVAHTIRFRIIGNNNSYDLILPINQLNTRGVDYETVILERTGGTIYAGEGNAEQYNYVAVYPNNDSVSFEFTIAQDSYLKDVAVLAMPTYKTYDPTAIMNTYDELVTLVENGSANIIGMYSNQATTMNISDNPLFLTFDKLNGVVYADTYIKAPNDQIGGSTYKFTLTTGECSLGENYAIAIVPVTEKYDSKLLGDHASENAYETNLSVEKTITSDTDSTLTYTGAVNDYVYVNYKTLFDTTAGGTVTMTYDTINTITVDLNANSKDKFNSLGINTESYAAFFNPSKLIPGTDVTVEVAIYRNGAVAGMQQTGDADAFDTVTFTWKVSEEDYYRLFKDDVITLRSSNSIEADTDIATDQVVNNILGYVVSEDEPFDNVDVYVTNHNSSLATADANWTIQNNINLLNKYDGDWYYSDSTKVAFDSITKIDDNLDFGMYIYNYRASINNPSGGSSGGSGSSTPDTNSKETYSINIEQSENGTISQSTTTGKNGDNVTFTIKANDGWEIADVIIDGKSVGPVSSYTFENVKGEHTISATFKQTEIIDEPDDNTWKNPFEDVNEDDWFYEAVKFVNKNDLFRGMSDTEFGPKYNLTRGMLVTVLYRLAKGEADSIAIFDDVAEDAYYAEAIAWASENGIVKGISDTEFAPNANITRQDLATIVYRYAQSLGKGFDGQWMFLLEYEDTDQIRDYAYEPIAWCSMNGIIKGRDTNEVDPFGLATRAETAAIIQRFVEYINK